MLERIVIALDGSSCAANALAYAVELARSQPAVLDVVAVLDPIAVAGHMPESLQLDRKLETARAELQQIVDTALAGAHAEGVAAEGHIVEGEPAQAIVAFAQRNNDDAIVMGTHGRSGFKRLFMGSVAEEVLRTASCPVVTIREAARIELGHAEPVRPKEGEPVTAVRLLEVAPSEYERLYGEIASFMSGPGREIAGAREAQVFGSLDHRRIMIVAHFDSAQDWTRAQWNRHLGELLDEIVANSQTLEFDLYRQLRFPEAAAAS